MNEALANKFMQNGYSVVNDATFSKVSTKNQEIVLANLLRNQQKLRNIEQEALIQLIGNFENLKKIIARYPSLDEKTKSIMYLMISNICDKFQEFYRYSLYLQYEKKSYKSQMDFNKKVIGIVKDYSNNLDMQSQKLLETELTDEAREIYHNSTLLQKGFNYQQNLMDNVLKKYTFYDYVDLLDSELDVLGRGFGNMKLPDDLLREVTSWYKSLEKQIEHQVTKVNIARSQYNEYCNKYGLKPIRKMKKKDYVVSLLKLYNPNKTIDYDFFSDRLYIPEVNSLRLPNGFVLNHARQELTADIFDKPLVMNIGQNYTLDSFTARLKEINPNGNIRIEQVDNNYTIVSDIKLNDLILPMEFDVKVDPLTNKPIINNNNSGQTQKLSFDFRYVPRKVKKNEPINKVSVENKEHKPSPKEEIMKQIVNLNGHDKVMIMNGRLLTTVKKIKDFKLPVGFYNDIDRNITNKKFATPEGTISITIRYVSELPKKVKEKTKMEEAKEENITLKEEVKAPKTNRKKVVDIKKSRKPKNKKAKRIAIGLMKVLGSSVKAIGVGAAYGILTPLSWLLNKIKTLSKDSMHHSFNQLQKDYEEIIMQSKHLALPKEQQEEFEKQLSALNGEVKVQEQNYGYEDSFGEYSLDDILAEYQERGKGR